MILLVLSSFLSVKYFLKNWANHFWLFPSHESFNPSLPLLLTIEVKRWIDLSFSLSARFEQLNIAQNPGIFKFLFLFHLVIIMFKQIWQFHKTEPISRKTLFLPKHQGGIGLIHPQYHSLAMRLKHFLKLKEKTNQETWIILTRYNLASILYRLDKNFKYMISNNTMKTKKPNINFYYEDIITYL